MKLKMKNTILTEDTELLDETGQVLSPGFARHPLWNYDRSRIHAPGFRIKEWDYYLVMTDEFAAAFTISDLGYLRMASVSFLDFEKGTDHTRTLLKPAGAPFMQENVIVWTGKDMMLRFTSEGDRHHVWCWWKQFGRGSDFRADLTFLEEPRESMNIVTPWPDRRKFYYNTKINCMPVTGTIVHDWHVKRLDADTDSGILDRGRGVWPYRIHWLWGTCSTQVNGIPFGFSIGYGFGDTSAASENVIFYDGAVHKLDDITLEIPQNPMLPWTVSSSDGRFEAVFTPELDRTAHINALLIESDQHQYFGRITGVVILDNGRQIEMRDLRCAIEDIRNRY